MAESSLPFLFFGNLKGYKDRYGYNSLHHTGSSHVLEMNNTTIPSRIHYLCIHEEAR